jgi:hypothetical protein
MTMQEESRATDGQSMSLDRIDRFVSGLREAFGENRLVAASLLIRVARRLAGAASRPDREDFLRAALRKAFSERDAEGVALRSNIETLVEGGEMKPSVAESWAKTFGWSPFSGWADPAKFDPMVGEFWTLPMAAAWIENHDREFASAEDQLWLESNRRAAYEKTGRLHEYVPISESAIRKDVREWNLEQLMVCVRRHWDAYIAQSTRWIEVSHSPLDEEEHPFDDGNAGSPASERTGTGYIVAPREDRGWSNLPGETTETKRLLCEALASGQLKAQRFVSGEFIVIPREQWSSINDKSSAIRIVGFPDDDGVYDSAGVYRAVAPDGAEYIAVRVPREQVMAAFPFNMPNVEAGNCARRKIGATELRGLVEAARRDDGTIPNADDLEEKFRADGLQVGRTPLRNMVKELSGRDGPGRPPKIRT